MGSKKTRRFIVEVEAPEELRDSELTNGIEIMLEDGLSEYIEVANTAHILDNSSKYQDIKLMAEVKLKSVLQD